MPGTYFISDLHLDPARPGTTRALADFLLKHSDCDALYILGDLFEAWIGDDDDAPLVAEVRTLLQQFSGAGSSLFIMQGNRDFLLGENFCRSVGASLLPDPSVIDLCGIPTLLMHGDSLCTEDRDYQQFRVQARAPEWQSELLSKSLEERRALATQLRAMSKEASSNKAADIMDVTPSAVSAAMQAHHVERLIHGHTHRPARHEEPSGERWVLGDWDRTGWAIKADKNHIELFEFNIFQ